jgi:succinate dehydrogenase/fumarate reductase flavoprotein subunit
VAFSSADGGAVRGRTAADVDVVVVGSGAGGAAAAIAAHDAGGTVLILEKLMTPGGISILSGGGIAGSTDARQAEAYLRRTQGGRVDDALIKAFAQDMVVARKLIERLAPVSRATIQVLPAVISTPSGARIEDNYSMVYPFPGNESMVSITVTVPEFQGFDWVVNGGQGQHLMKVLLDNLAAREIRVLYGAAATRLVRAGGRVSGVRFEQAGTLRTVRARRGVILACGGFEFNEDMKKQFLEPTPIYPTGCPGNTGDGITMAQQAGAALWHMWHVHGSYGFKFDEFPVAFRMKPSGARRPNRPLQWILVDKRGQRFMNELQPAPQDTSHRPLGHFDPDAQEYPRIPAFLVFDEEARKLGPLANPRTAVAEHAYRWSQDNLAEVARGWIAQGQSVEALAARLGLPGEALARTIERWNHLVEAGRDEDHGRPPRTMLAILRPPFFGVPVWPVVMNTQGGPRHDEFQRIIDVEGHPIPGLYAAGELGSFFAHLYLLGGNLTECITSGARAGTHIMRGARADGDAGRAFVYPFADETAPS